MARGEAGNRPHQGCVGVQVEVATSTIRISVEALTEPFSAIALTPGPPHLATTRKRTFDTRGFASGDQHGGAAPVCGVKVLGGYSRQSAPTLTNSRDPWWPLALSPGNNGCWCS